jgi:hypothetical protein
MLVLPPAARLKRREFVMPRFELAMGGYDRGQVDPLVEAVEAARDSRDPATRQEALKALQMRLNEGFRQKFKGYAKIQVLNYVEERVRELGREA